MAKKEKPAAAPESAPAGTRARVLFVLEHDGKSYPCDSIIEASAAVIAAYKSAGLVDDHPDAVAYILSLQAQ